VQCNFRVQRGANIYIYMIKRKKEEKGKRKNIYMRKGEKI
jgi:hypothetical protein